jgi:pantothenate kinase
MTVSFDSLVERARALVAGGRRAVLGITGAPGAGKSTLAEELVAALAPPSGDWVAYLPMDGFHLADVELDRLGLRDVKGAPDTFDALGYAALLRRWSTTRTRSSTRRLRAGHRAADRRHDPDRAAGPPDHHRGQLPAAGHPRWRSVRPLLAEVWYADLDQDTRLDRLIARHVRFGKPEPAAIAWATGTDERNAAVIAAHPRPRRSGHPGRLDPPHRRGRPPELACFNRVSR